jgi:hypothetical protein
LSFSARRCERVPWLRRAVCALTASYALQGETKDLLFILTERHKFCVLEYSAGASPARRAAWHRC